ncbi:MAG: hypothetical protein AAGA47_03200 [Pseudomonadota bacterium]
MVELIGNLITFAVGFVFGWLPWQVGAIFAGLFVILIVAFSRMIDWTDPGAGFISFLPLVAVFFLPGLIVGLCAGIFVKWRGHA